MPVTLHMGWRHLLFANWPIEPEELAAHVPAKLTLDTYEGDAWLSATPFTNRDVRPAMAPAGTGLRLPELNLRTYVTYHDEPGVYFLSLDIDDILAVLGARLFHHLPYFYANSQLRSVEGEIHVTSRRRHPGARPVDFVARYAPVGPARPAEPDSLAEFLAERYRYYTEGTDGRIRFAEVRHAPWQLSDAEATLQADSLIAASGISLPGETPTCLYSRGVDTRISPNRPIDAG